MTIITKTALITCVAFLSGFILSAYAILTPEIDSEVQIQTEIVSVQPDFVESESSNEYVVKSGTNGVYIFRYNDLINPIDFREIALDFIPENDKVMFDQGVIISGDENLAHFLEDFAP